MNTATMTSKGQITVPKEVRDALHLEPGTQMTFRLTENGGVELRPRSWDTSKMKGMIKPPPGVHVSIKEMNEVIARGWARIDRGGM
jgi:AbrB family looped-hinge helix DNA binding protein